VSSQGVPPAEPPVLEVLVAPPPPDPPALTEVECGPDAVDALL
jgi:hypothetical protein